MKAIILSATLMLFLFSCKKEDVKPNKQYTITVMSNAEFGEQFDITVKNHPSQTVKTKLPGEIGKYYYEDVRPQTTTIKASMRKLDTIVVKYFENGNIIDSSFYTCKSDGCGAGVNFFY